MPTIGSRRVILLSAFAAAIAIGFGAWTSGPSVSRKKISAGTVEFSPTIGPHRLQGSFKVSTSSSKNAILSKGTGGACLLADLNHFCIPTMSAAKNRKCATNSDCTAGLPAKWSGYCHEEACWVRPGPDTDLCNKSPFVPWAEDVDHPAPPDPFDLSVARYPEPTRLESFSRVYPGPVKWRVVACLNGIDPVKDSVSGELKPACAANGATDLQRMLVFGPPREVHPDPKVPSPPMKGCSDVPKPGTTP